MRCELREDERLGAGVDVQLWLGGELVLSQRQMTADGARFVADSFKKDHLRTGWAE